MPARTLSPFRATDRALLSPSSRYPPYPPPDSPHHEQQIFQRRAEDPTVLYDVTGPPHDSIARMDHNPFTAGGHADAVPHPMRRPSTVGWYIVSGQPHATAHGPTPSPPLAGWLPHPPHLTRIAPLIPPPPLIHKVWILDCQSCGTFLTNRGMKVSNKNQ
ncbi:hypothetical protein PHLCEN_2v10272 [Hermanssonia centrifuga]|uniref:Uncharacterized protein n=1 Tax=Hermanssonia centrifuga TaxID=98765 RepID=A0A2R6NNF5_9APHY|nr:hypothetical protein PHLCEN_2v10272 [Hermanssonia centrifuga]